MKYYAFYLDSFDWGITTDSSYEGEMSLWDECNTLAEAKKALVDFFSERIKDDQRMRKCARKIKRQMVANGNQE